MPKNLILNLADHAAGGADLARGLLLTALGAVLMSFVLANSMAVWLPKTWGLAVDEPHPVAHALSAAGFTWLGFVLPVLLHRLGWERPSVKLFAINGGYYFVSLLVAALVLAFV